MLIAELDRLIGQLLPTVLADRELGDGRRFTLLHFNRLWALTCLRAGECFDEELLAARLPALLPPRVIVERECLMAA